MILTVVDIDSQVGLPDVFCKNTGLLFEVELPEVPLAVENRALMILREYLRPN